MKFKTGDTVKTIVAAPCVADEHPGIAVGDIGTIIECHGTWSTYGVMFDTDLYPVTAFFFENDLEAES